MGNIKAAVVDREGDVKTQTYASRGLVRWARALPTLFSESTRAITPSRAKPEIWTNKVDFEAKAAAYASAAQRMADMAATGDRPAFIAAWQATGATCKSCHDLYQAPAQPSS
jgi:cytochrome c556